MSVNIHNEVTKQLKTHGKFNKAIVDNIVENITTILEDSGIKNTRSLSNPELTFKIVRAAWDTSKLDMKIIFLLPTDSDKQKEKDNELLEAYGAKFKVGFTFKPNGQPTLTVVGFNQKNTKNKVELISEWGKEFRAPTEAVNVYVK